MIRRGESESFVELSLYLPFSDLASDGNITVSREIWQNGRNVCKINGRIVTVSELKEFMKNVIDIHGQHDNQNIMDVSSHIEYLDNFIGKDIKEIKNEYRKYFARFNEIESELKKNYGDDKERERKISLLKYQLNEIEEAKLKKDEEEELEAKRKIMLNSEKIAENLNITDNNISEIALDAVTKSIKSLEKIENLDEKYAKNLETIRSIYYDLQEVSRDICDLKDIVDFDANLGEKIEERLHLIYALKRKYGNNIQEILIYKETLKKEIMQIENLEEYNKKLKIELEELKDKMNILAKKLNKFRIENGIKLQEAIDKELEELEMKNAKFMIKIEFNEKEEYNSNGLDRIEFMIMTNIGEDAKPFVKIASGGEISRVMLAIKTVLSNTDNVPTLIFDEIDTGISGKAASKVGEKLKKISKKHQVICVTHLANIVAKGDYNYFINKIVIDEKTKTNIKLLNEKETLEEIARISTGDITSAAIEHAKELRGK